ncbi:hypothetical protein ACFP1Z_17975 [Streptomyces gamaensis]|uniref:Uncharacterized protein n=1 Tax=Streptomyces gamaensis TaxID=1763542 RepID=A0ABW0Z1V0_9ACTN
MSSSGLIYAVIVGAWAAYLVPMWLRRQDELNEARPTERFSTAIRLLSGRAGMERRYAKDLEGRVADDAPPADGPAGPGARGPEPDAPTEPVAVRPSGAPSAAPPAPHAPPALSSAERARRSKVLARRRRTTVMLFLAFTLGAVIAGVFGLGFLWAPAAPAVLLSAYIVYLRSQERRRFAFTMDQRRAELAAQRLREGRAGRARPADRDAAAADTAPHPAPAAPDPAAGRRALVELTDHAEWVDAQRSRGGESWEPVPVPLPTYVTAPVAPRGGDGADPVGPDTTWSSARSSSAEPAPEQGRPEQERRAAGRRRRPRERGRTPLFDQYAEDGRPRAANE